jgi:hypothetical protein
MMHEQRDPLPAARSFTAGEMIVRLANIFQIAESPGSFPAFCFFISGKCNFCGGNRKFYMNFADAIQRTSKRCMIA